jgi:hypothetical protein
MITKSSVFHIVENRPNSIERPIDVRKPLFQGMQKAATAYPLPQLKVNLSIRNSDLNNYLI